jgi:hypothetical protein
MSEQEPVTMPGQTSPLDNEFRTITTKPEPRVEEEEEGVLFPDASETRAKKLGTIKWSLKTI